MDFTTDKLRSLVRKWQTLIEAHVDVKTTDGYTLRVFCLSFTKKRQGQIKRTCYAQSAQVRTLFCSRAVKELCMFASVPVVGFGWLFSRAGHNGDRSRTGMRCSRAVTTPMLQKR
jgi:hypothetical protein